MIEGRLVAMSVNLSTKSYQGGVLQIRKKKSHQVIAEIQNVGLGDAVLFRVSEELEHRVTSVQGGLAKVTFAGWFDASNDDFWSFRGNLKRSG